MTTTLLDEAINASKSDVAKMPKYLPLSTAQNIETISALKQKINKVNVPSYKENPVERFASGFAMGVTQLNDVLPSFQLYGETAQLAIGGYFGAKEDFVERKKLNIVTLQRNLIAEQQNRYKNTAPENVDNWAYGLGQGAFNYGLMLLGGGLAGATLKTLGAGAAARATASTVTGLTANALLENVEQQSERMPVDNNGKIDTQQITPEWAKTSTIGTTAYLGISTILEKGFGFGKQVKMWETPIKTSNKAIKVSSPVLKQAAKTALSEGVTEGLQSLASTGILLAEGKIDVSQLPERLKDAWKEAVIGGILGGTTGTAVGINQSHNVKTMLNEEISKVVTNPEECEKIVDAIYESGTVEMTNVISKELELSSELNNKHGAIYDSMQGAIYDAINNAGAFEGVSEAEIAQYVSDTSKTFANQVLAEANKRGVLIDEVLKASDIKFENGKIYMQAGKEIIAETPIIQEEVSAKIIDETQTLTQSKEEKEAESFAFDILEKATKKSTTYLKMVLKSELGNKKASQREKILELARNVADEITVGGINPEWAKYFDLSKFDEYGTGETGANLDLVEQAINIIENGYYKKDVYEIGNDYANYIQENINELKLQFDNAKTFDELNDLFNNLDKLPDSLQLEFVMDELVESYIQNSERLENEQNGKNKEIGRNTEKISESNFGTTQTGDVTGIRKNTNQIQGQTPNQEITPDTKLYQEMQDIDKTGTEYNEPIININGVERPTTNSDGKAIAKTKEAIEHFYKWFGDSKVVNENGKPLVVYHGSPNKFEVFDKRKIGTRDSGDFGKGFYFTKWYDRAGDYSGDTNYNPYTEKENYKNIYPVYLNIKNPYFATETQVGQLDTDALKARGYDGVAIYFENKYTEKEIQENEDVREELAEIEQYANEDYKIYNHKGELVGEKIIDEFVAFEPEQIKSVDNQGTFDESNPNIYMQLKNTPKQPKIFKGAYDVSAKAIELFKDADYSTLPHELAHFWLDNMWGYYRSGKASEAYTNNFKGVLDWLEVKDGQINLTRNQQEKFARGYEKYLLNGYAPNGLIQGAFDDYDKWLQKVYNDARELKVKLTPDAIEFFDSMTTGELPEYDVPETQAQIREQNIEQMNKDIETARKFVVEKQAEYNNYDGGNVITKDTVPVTTEGEKKQSKAYTNQASILGIAEELNYNKADIAEQNKLASEYVKNNLDEARQVVNGEKEAPKNILKNAIYNAYLKEMLAIGDNEAYVNALKNQSLELTRAGQEIASQRGAIENIFDSGYWIRRIENLKKSKLASQKFGNGWTASEQEQALSKMNDFIKNKVEAVMSEFMEAEPEQQKKIAEKLSKDIAAEFKVKPDTKLYQSMYEPSEVKTRTNAYNYIYRYINSALGLDLTKAQYNEIIAKTMAIQKSIETTRNRNGNPSALFFKNISEMENYANSIEPSPALAILTSTVGRGNMLFSPKTIALNIESNIVNFFTEAITRRIQNGAVNMAVDPQAIKDYLAYSREVFNTSGYQVSSMPTLDPTTQILSEKMTTTAGDRAVDKLGRFFEQTIFKYGLGAPDLFFKDMTFVDTANVLATKEAKGDSKKATELFKDICLIEPKTAKGKELREIAINEALIATYQNKGTLSEGALKVREGVSALSNIVLPKSIKMGDLLSPFVKTPANVIGLGFDYSMGGLLALRNIKSIYNDIQNGTFTEGTRKSLRSLARNGIGFVAAAMISSLIDDDDYIPEYALLDAKQRELVKMKGGVFNSVKIGDKYISLDYFGPLAMPLVSFLNARRGNDIKDKVWNYFQGSAYQALKLPVISDIKSLLEGTGRTLSKDVNENIKMAQDAAIDFVSSRSIPAIVTDIAKMTDPYERETNNNAINRLKSKVPILREELPAQYNYGTGQPRETQNPVSQLFAGARVKEEVSSPVIREIDKLNSKNTDEKVNIAKVTKTGLLSSLSDEKKNKIEKEFAQRYATNVKAFISTTQYKNLDTSEKVKALNKIRNNIRDDIKVEYGLAKPKKAKPKKRKRSK